MEKRLILWKVIRETVGDLSERNLLSSDTHPFWSSDTPSSHLKLISAYAASLPFDTMLAVLILGLD